MFAHFFRELRAAGVPVTLREYLDFLAALRAGVPGRSAEGLYFLGRTVLVKDEAHFDRYDRVFGAFFEGARELLAGLEAEIPEDWLREALLGELSDEEKAAVQALGDFDALLEAFRERLREQQDRHQGGNKWIGTGGTSPFGHGGYHPEGIRIGGAGRNRRAVKVWEQREYRNLSDDVALGTRNLKVALRRLRRLAREGAPEELDLDGTIRGSARRGYVDIQMRPELRNRIKVLLLLDVGGSMDVHVRLCERLFSAARAEFQRLEYFYFHNCLYERVWRDNRRRRSEIWSTDHLLRSFSADHRVIIVGDASMSPYEITHPGGSVEHWNPEPGQVWMQRLLRVYERAVWLNPEPQHYWDTTPSIRMLRELMEDRMYPLTLGGLEQAVRRLAR